MVRVLVTGAEGARSKAAGTWDFSKTPSVEPTENGYLKIAKGARKSIRDLPELHN